MILSSCVVQPQAININQQDQAANGAQKSACCGSWEESVICIAVRGCRFNTLPSPGCYSYFYDIRKWEHVICPYVIPNCKKVMVPR